MAYLDPGTGSLIVQIVIGFAVGGAATVKVFWKQIKVYFTSRFSHKSANEPDGE